MLAVPVALHELYGVTVMVSLPEPKVTVTCVVLLPEVMEEPVPVVLQMYLVALVTSGMEKTPPVSLAQNSV